jgi:hypothetical protein
MARLTEPPRLSDATLVASPAAIVTGASSTEATTSLSPVRVTGSTCRSKERAETVPAAYDTVARRIAIMPTELLSPTLNTPGPASTATPSVPTAIPRTPEAAMLSSFSATVAMRAVNIGMVETRTPATPASTLPAAMDISR